MTAHQHNESSPQRVPQGRVLPFDSGAEEELVTSMGRAAFTIGADGKPNIEYKRWGKDTIAVHMSSKVLPNDPKIAGFSFEVGPLREESARFNLSNLEVRLLHSRSGAIVHGFASDDGRSVAFFPVEIGASYRFEFGETINVLAVPPRPKPSDDGPLKARERPPLPDSFPGGVLATT